MNDAVIIQGLSRCIAIWKAIRRLLLYSRTILSTDYNKALNAPLFVGLIGEGGRLRFIPVKTVIEALKKSGVTFGVTLWGYTFEKTQNENMGLGLHLGLHF